MKVLFLNHTNISCGVYQYGKHVSNILSTSNNVNEIQYVYKEVSSLQEYNEAIKNLEYSYIVYNYMEATMPWLNEDTIQKIVRNIGIVHETDYIFFFDYVLNIDPTSEETIYSLSLPRPLFDVKDLSTSRYSSDSISAFCEKGDSKIPIIGSFGFGGLNKGFDKVLNMVNENFENAIIKLVIGIPHFAGNEFQKQQVSDYIETLRNTKMKEGISLFITREFFTNEDLLKFLSSNDINIFLYEYQYGRGCSSVLDYALSVDTPLVLSESWMFKHVTDRYKNFITENLNELYTDNNKRRKNIETIKQLRKVWSAETMVEQFSRLNYGILTSEFKIPKNVLILELYNEKKRNEFVAESSLYFPWNIREVYNLIPNDKDRVNFFTMVYLYMQGGIFFTEKSHMMFFDKRKYSVSKKLRVKKEYLIKPTDAFIENEYILACVKSSKEMFEKIRDISHKIKNRFISHFLRVYELNTQNGMHVIREFNHPHTESFVYSISGDILNIRSQGSQGSQGSPPSELVINIIFPSGEQRNVKVVFTTNDIQLNLSSL